ncbi:MAG: tail fiber protein [Pyrinomonadaceae bacterium]
MTKHTTYGGNGVSTFGLPNLQGRAPLHPGQDPDHRNISWGNGGARPSL